MTGTASTAQREQPRRVLRDQRSTYGGLDEANLDQEQEGPVWAPAMFHHKTNMGVVEIAITTELGMSMVYVVKQANARSLGSKANSGRVRRCPSSREQGIHYMQISWRTSDADRMDSRAVVRPWRIENDETNAVIDARLLVRHECTMRCLTGLTRTQPAPLCRGDRSTRQTPGGGRGTIPRFA